MAFDLRDKLRMKQKKISFVVFHNNNNNNIDNVSWYYNIY